jgi:hypothetical protein
MRAQITIYSSQSDFNSAAGSISTQTFESVAANLSVGAGQGLPINNPLTNSTNSGILTGLTIDATTDVGADLFVSGPNYLSLGFTNYDLFSNQFGGLDLYYTQGASAASVDFLSVFGNDVDISVYDTSDNLIGSSPYDVSGTPTSGAGEFWGITDTGDTIGSIEVDPTGQDILGIDQAQFSSPAITPEPSSLLLLGTGLLGAFGVIRRKIKA